MKRFFTSTRFLFIVAVSFIIIGLGNFITKRTNTSLATAAREPIVAQKSVTDVIASLATPSLTPTTLPPGSKPLVYAKAYSVIDAETRLPLLQKNADMSVPIASTTKIMTALVTLDTLPLDKVVTVPKEAAQIEGSEIQLLTGEQMTVENLLYALMMNSANDGAMALAMANGSKDDFIALMNKKAKQLGLQNTEYKDPVGLDDTGHSSAHDLALLAVHALDNELFRTIVKTEKRTIWSADNKYKHELKNSNHLLQTDSPLYLASAIGIKTGFTFDAGHCLVAGSEVGDKRFIAVVLNTNENTISASAKEARKLLTWANQLAN